MRLRAWGIGAAATAASALGGVAVVGELTIGTSGRPPADTVTAVALALVGLSWFAVGAYLALRRPRNPLGWLFLCVGAGTQAGVAGEIADRAGWISWQSSPWGIGVDFVAGVGIFLLLGLLPILYPTGRFAGGVSGAAAALTCGGAVLTQVHVLHARIDPAHTWPFGPDVGAVPTPWWELWAPWVVYGAGVLGGWALCLARLAHARYPLRQQLVWLLIAVVAVMVSATLGESSLALGLQAIALLLLPVAVAVGIARYQLLGIETALPRALTAGVLVAAISGVYLTITAVSGAQLTGAAVPSVVAAAVVAAVLLPLHDRLRRLVDRVVYGRRADPVRAVADLGSVVASGSASDMLHALLTEVAGVFRASGARILDARGEVVAAVGDIAVGDKRLAAGLVLAGEPLGTIEIIAPARSSVFREADAAILRAIAGTVALAVRSAALADELEAQRDAVVEASASARDRLRRDLHDGLGPSLAGLRLGLQALVDAESGRDAGRAAEIMAVVRAEADRAVVEVRRIIEDLRPSDLDGVDLATALRTRLDATGVLVPVLVHTAVPPLPARTEDAVFRIVTEAVANAQRHAAARSIRVSVAALDRTLVARVADDGCGIAEGTPSGIGLNSMRTRASELGGSLEIVTSGAGTTVTTRLPLGTAGMHAATGRAS